MKWKLVLLMRADLKRNNSFKTTYKITLNNGARGVERKIERKWIKSNNRTRTRLLWPSRNTSLLAKGQEEKRQFTREHHTTNTQHPAATVVRQIIMYLHVLQHRRWYLLSLSKTTPHTKRSRHGHRTTVKDKRRRGERNGQRNLFTTKVMPKI